MSDRIVIPSDRFPVPVKGVTLFTDTDPELIKGVLRFFRLSSTTLEDGPGHKAHRTKSLKSIIGDISKIESPDTDTVVKSLTEVLTPSKVSSTIDVDEDFDTLMSSLSDLTSPSSDDTDDTDDTPSTDDTDSPS